jgi:plasmid stabilization system protein ParE
MSCSKSSRNETDPLVEGGQKRSPRDTRLHSPGLARRFIDRIKVAVESLRQFPEAGAIVPERDSHAIREIYVGNYRVIYRVQTGVEVIAVIHAARQLPCETIKN